MSTPTVLIWDLGNVFVAWDPRNLYRKLFPATPAGEAAMEQFLATVVTLETFNRRLDLGEKSADLCAEAILRHPDVDPDLINAYNTRWGEMIAGEVPGTADLLRKARSRNVPCFALSNWGADVYPTTERFPVLAEFDGRVISCEIGLVKPDPAIFHHTLDRFGLQAENCLFIDDSRKNIDAAADVGLHVHHFTSSSELARHLDELGIVPLGTTER